jgi:YD repeat-containing protein
VQYQTVGGAWMTIYLNFGTTQVHGKVYAFGDPDCMDGSYLLGQNITVLRSIVFPQTEPNVNPRQFSFAYNSDTSDTVNQSWYPSPCNGPQTITSTSHGLGSLSQITMPSGAVVKYVYQFDGQVGFMDPNDLPRESLATKELEHDNITEGETWTYFNSQSGLGGFIAPDGSFVSQTMYPSDRAFSNNNAGFGGKEGLVYRINQSHKLLVEKRWTLMRFTGGDNIAAGANVLVTFNPVVDAEYTSLLDDTPNHNPVKMSAKTYQYDYNGNLLSQRDYDWFDPSLVSRDAQGVPTGVPAGAAVLRVTNNSYYNQATGSTSGNVYAKRPLSSATPMILNALQQSTVGPNAEQPISFVQLSYDGQGYGAAPTVGNLTSQNVWDDLDNKWITSSQTYGDYGNLITNTDPRGKVTQFYFDDATHALPNRGCCRSAEWYGHANDHHHLRLFYRPRHQPNRCERQGFNH